MTESIKKCLTTWKECIFLTHYQYNSLHILQKHWTTTQNGSTVLSRMGIFRFKKMYSLHTLISLDLKVGRACNSFQTTFYNKLSHTDIQFQSWLSSLSNPLGLSIISSLFNLIFNYKYVSTSARWKFKFVIKITF